MSNVLIGWFEVSYVPEVLIIFLWYLFDVIFAFSTSFKKNHNSCKAPYLFRNTIFLPDPYLVQSILLIVTVPKDCVSEVSEDEKSCVVMSPLPSKNWYAPASPVGT